MDLKEKIKKMEKAYIKMTTQPVITSAEIEELNHEILIDLTRTSTDVIMQNKRKMLTTLHYSPKSKSYKIINTVEQTNTVCDVKNRLGGRIKIINQNERSYLEIWSKTEKHTSIDLTKLNLHGKVLENNENFNSLKWSQDCKYFCYLAEKDKAPEKQKYFNDEQDYNKYVFKESFGEQLSTIYDPVLVLINTDNLEIKIFDDFTEEYSIFSANFSYSDNILVVTCYLTKPYKFGQRFINNTDTKVFLLDYESKKVSTIQKYAKCFYNNETLKNVNDIENFDFPKVCFRNCIFLKSDLNEMCLLSTRTNVQGAHFQHSWIYCLNLTTGQVTCSTESYCLFLFNTKHIINNSTLYFTFLDKDCTTKLAQLRLVNKSLTDKDTRIQLIVKEISLESLNVTCISTDSKYTHFYNVNQFTSVNLLLVSENFILVTFSSILIPTSVGIIHLKNGEIEYTTYFYVDSLDQYTDLYENGEPSIEMIDRNILLRTNRNCKKIVYLNETTIPLMVIVHGGPHSCFKHSFSVNIFLWLLAGCDVLLTNYVGSIGGKSCASVNELLGNIGTIDVNQVQCTVESIMNRGRNDKVYVNGGSHGGFILLHLLGKWPEFYNAATSRNPVFDISSMISITDIQTWATNEALNEEFNFYLNKKLLAELYDKSPIVNVQKIKTPLLLMIGAKDLRVPPSQSYLLRKQLLANSCEIRTLLYPEDNHSLSSIPTEHDTFMNIYSWYLKH